MKYSLHNHTYRCKHASGDELAMCSQGYIDGFEVFGISDHIAYPIAETKYRMEFSEKDEYLQTLKELKEQYKDKFKFYRGFEAEYQKEFIPYLKSLFKDDLIDYLVLGQHYYDVNKPQTYYGGARNYNAVTTYVNHCLKAMESGLFLFLVHPDLFLNAELEFDEFVKQESIRLIQGAIDHEVYLEYNAGGLRNGIRYHTKPTLYSYPRTDFWQLVAQMQAEVVVNADAHSPIEISDKAYEMAENNAKALNLNLVEEIDFERYFKRIKQVINQ